MFKRPKHPMAFKKVFFPLLYLRIIALQSCVGFCHISSWTSQRYTCISPPWISFPPPTSSCPSNLSQGIVLSIIQQFPMAIYFTHGLLSQFIPPSLGRVFKDNIRVSVTGYVINLWTFFCLVSCEETECCFWTLITNHLAPTILGSTACGQPIVTILHSQWDTYLCRTSQRYTSDCYKYPSRRN